MRNLVLFFSILLFIQTLHATIINVPTDTATIQGGINMAINGDTVLVANGTYYENINFKGKAITVASHFYIDGDSTHIDSTIIDGSQPSNPDSGSVVYFGSGEDTTSVLCGFTITGGSGTYTPQYSVRLGGGIACWFSGASIISNKIVNNTLNDNTNWVIGGGVCTGYVGSNAYVILENNLIINNEANSPIGAYGGGVALACNGRLIDNVISYNSCISTAFEANGGGIKTVSDPSSPITVLIKGNKITHNFAEGKKVSGHNGAKGGGIVNHYCKVFILENDILYNQVNAIEGGDAYGAGIGMVIANNESIISRNTISFNTIADSIPNSGGGILIRYSNILVTNNIISNNSASNGGGISSDNYRNPVIVNNTIVNNTATSNGGGLYSTESNPIVLNTIFWDNYAGNGAGIYPSILTKVLYSDVQNGYSGTGNINTDPLFADTLLYNLSDSSHCVGWGTDSVQISGTWYYAPNIDYDGDPRPNPVDNFVDMGAQESDFLINGIINEDSDNLPNTFSLKQNYPNPFNPTTTIEFNLPKSEFVTLRIYNLLGQEVATLVSEKLTAGQNKYEWDASGFASGIYIYRLETKTGFVQSRKLVLLK